jgi:hypothetical protein
VDRADCTVKRLWQWLAGLSLVAVLGGVIAALLRRRPVIPPTVKADVDELAEGYLEVVEKHGQTLVDQTSNNAKAEIAAADQELEEHANESPIDDPADWARPGRGS